MKYYKLILFILIVFLKTGNVLSNSNIFNVNNIEIEKKGKTLNDTLANQAIKKGFDELIDKILLKKDLKKLEELKFSEIKELVNYYQVSNTLNDKNDNRKINYNISFDKDKMYNLFYKKNISYSEINKKELFILPVLKKNNKIYIFNQNYFYDSWNEENDNQLIEFILLQENIEIIQNINEYKDNLLSITLKDLFQEYYGNNLALILIEIEESKEEKIYFKTEILGKNIVRNFSVKRLNLNNNKFYKKIIIETKKEITNLIKSRNLIDIRAPSFLNTVLKIDNKNNLIELNSRLKKIYLIDEVYVQTFNKEFIFLKIKFLGKLDNIINQLQNEKITLKLIDDEWIIKIN
jgi:hypothetical protein